MPFRRSSAAILLSTALVISLGSCSSSDNENSASSTTLAEASTTASPNAGEPTTSGPSTSEPTTTAQPQPDALPSCQEILQRYTEVFIPDNLKPLVDLWRTWIPHMPKDVGEATGRLADAYEEAGSLGNIDMADVDLTADAQIFSDWTNEGCPAG
ncbi:MAG: hypothetical protein KDA95_00065 [Acidimicrobiales bacterium]|nr:hypothetical protein [Acidimicrobiales bacterium]